MIQFSHANGFPGSCYGHLFSLLPEHEVSCVEKMGHGDYPLNGSLRNYAEELIAEIEQQHNKPVIGVGHSAGAVVTLIAAALKPELFRQVILLDPVVFSKRKRYALKLCKALGLMDRITPAGRAAKRRAQFASREEAEAYFAGKSLFKDFHPACFADYIKHGLTENEQGVELSISADIEADVFRNVLLDVPRCLKRVRGTVIYGRKSHLFNRHDKRWWQRNFPEMNLVAVDGGHLFPLESPEITAELINSALSK
ncbi:MULTISPECIES: alpha/beta fold hydrolase [unclassified Marinobacterium]|uniref:alpha/beta fold hydrolase n=1 Tax=unclassified Marinobacterium TaxID=2644139 RepID=UPI001567DD51|nr:Alpha/beta hydrolase family protein [Marinobacterium sp. xm-g-48]NRP16046.1 Alpha/beta hydrolase family protein [Marinobacterium sp. xm-a-152]NRP35500.1 Alpha/beta hydrolase family protein [Marinobacterium sp. xm-d-579]NRP37763.1 Alpha/beta hydrolase family protein [Marinobacterium sp. xm-a-121]NRP46200.1 Alpha/beta hydrolase family protein [Marinobacterium sp. xm-d-543]NRP52819.1 Alpha/beta hydrolase family protein [Marinobacterium sp. xm-v-242]NRP56414.1 Alpha/beta hydrolase family prote